MGSSRPHAAFAAPTMPFFPEDPSYDGDIVTIARRFDPIAAELLRGRLAADGIPATLGDAHLVQASALWATALGGVRVMVPTSYVPQALRAIAAIEHGELRLEDDGDEADAAGEADATRGEAPGAPELPGRARLPRQAAGVAALMVLFVLLELIGRLAPALR
jgi:hypothetical protein